MADPTLRKFALRAMLSLPGPALRGLAGGSVVYVGGRTLDPRLQFLAAQARRAPPMSAATPAQARAGSAEGLVLVAGRLERGVRVEAFTVPGAEGPVAARAYRSANQDPDAPLMVFAHFGGGVIGDLDTCEVFCSILARLARCPVLSVDYRLAPEHRFPAGLEDMLAAWRWARDNAPRFGAPTGHVAVGGDSMGGNFAATICQEAKRTGEPQPVLQLLIYPGLDLASESASMTTYAEAYPLSRATMEWFMGHYLGPGDSPADPRLSPLRTGDLSGLAPAVMATAGFDPLLDQGEAYARRLAEAGVPVAYRCYDHLAHAFTAFTGAVPAADLACREIAALVRAAFAAPSA
ncbi:MAG: alpha/beta hydrolase [Pseudomonadota bacterium]|nr:alpha/beta hydrolase [Pseudomonadota bacterium]